MNNIVEGLYQGNCASPCPARARGTRDFFKPESTALQYDKRLDLRILQRKTTAEYREGFAIDADETGRRVGDGFPKNWTEKKAEQANAELSRKVGVVESIRESCTDYHLAA